MNRPVRTLRRLSAACAVLLTLVLASLAFGASVAKGSDASSASAPDAVPGEVLVLFEDPAAAALSVDAAEGVARPMALDASSDAPAKDAAPVVVEGFEVEGAEVVAPDLAGHAVVSLELADDADTSALIDALDEIPGVTAQPNYLYEPFDEGEGAYVDDPDLAKQYHLGPLGDGTSDSGANLFAAWEAYATVDEPASVTVAVLDSGMDVSHPDLQENVRLDLAWSAETEKPLTGDATGHGTKVAGIIAATANNALGVSGGATGACASLTEPHVSVLPVNVSRSSDNLIPIDLLAKGVDYLIDLVESGELDDLRVVNMSLGTYATDEAEDKLFQHILDEFEEHGILCVASGGNGHYGSYTTPCYPSDFPEVLSVTSLSRQGANSYFSDYTRNKDISAPGEGIYTTLRSNAYGDRDEKGARVDGTSFSAPIVSSVVALMASANPSLTPAELHDLVRATAAPLPNDSNPHTGQTGSAGALDAGAAVSAAIARNSASELPAGTTRAHRLFNRWSGEHLLTADKDEYVGLRLNHYGDWLGDDASIIVNEPNTEGGTPVYRLYNEHNGDHFYTESEEEAASLERSGWTRENIAWRGAAEGVGIPVYRLYNPYMTENGGLGNHLWTTSKSECDALAALGWLPETATWLAVG